MPPTCGIYSDGADRAGCAALGEKEDDAVPMYDFRCTACKKTFSVVLAYDEYDPRKVKCPKCRKRKTVERVFSTVFAKTSKKS